MSNKKIEFQPLATGMQIKVPYQDGNDKKWIVVDVYLEGMIPGINLYGTGTLNEDGISALKMAIAEAEKIQKENSK